MLLDPLSISIPLASPSIPRPNNPSHPTRKLLQPSPSHSDDYILEVDNSSMEKFSTCPRAAENYLVHSRESAYDSSATSFGKLFHSCEELRLLHGLTPAVIQRQKELVVEHFLNSPVPPDDHRTAERMIQVLDMYNTRYVNDGWPEKVYTHAGHKMVEKAFKVQLCTIHLNETLPYYRSELVVNKDSIVDPTREDSLFIRDLHILWTGRIDIILSDSNALWITDHKTSSIGGETYYEDFRLSSQTVGYAWAAQKILGVPIAGLILNALIIKRPTMKVSNNTELDRRSYHYSQDRLVEWELNAKDLVSEFVSKLVNGYFPQKTKWCMGKYGKCPYHSNCCLPREQRAVDLSSDQFRNVTWNPIH